MSIIGKAESISHGRAAVKYAEEKQINGVDVADSFEMHGLSGETPEECFNEMRNWKNGTGHDNIKRDFLWLSFSPSKELIVQVGALDVVFSTIVQYSNTLRVVNSEILEPFTMCLFPLRFIIAPLLD